MESSSDLSSENFKHFHRKTSFRFPCTLWKEERNFKKHFFSEGANSGQVVVEYVLLLVIAVGLALFLTKNLVSRSQDNPGLFTSKWHEILLEIGKDLPDGAKGE